MRVVRVERLADEVAATRGGVAALGVFDGVHLGHQHVFRRTHALAGRLGAPAIVLTFAIHPVVVVKGLTPRLITSLPHRLRMFETHGFAECVVLPFDDTVREMAAPEFARRVFVEMLGLRGLVLGPDARVGRDRAGDVSFLRGFCAEAGIQLEVADELEVHGQRVSSTRIRAAISDGDLERARRMLGRDVSILGTVVPGDQRGRKLGFPTANLDLHHEIRPPAGVYAVRARVGGREIPGVLNIGIRPTFGPDGDLIVEAHLLDFEGDLYGQDVEVVLIARIRDEMRFASREELAARIATDIAEARRILATRPR
jgi:riboflavin kinase/FMN adenylyltransferase